MIVAKINLSEIPKERIFNGKKGKYIDLVIVKKREVDEYGHTHFVAVSQTKEERERKEDTIFVGAAVELRPKLDKEKIVSVGSNQSQSNQDDDNNDLPF